MVDCAVVKMLLCDIWETQQYGGVIEFEQRMMRKTKCARHASNLGRPSPARPSRPCGFALKISPYLMYRRRSPYLNTTYLMYRRRSPYLIAPYLMHRRISPYLINVSTKVAIHEHVVYVFLISIVQELLLSQACLLMVSWLFST